MNSGLSASDLLAITGGEGNKGFLEGNGIIILVLFLLLIGGDGFGNKGNMEPRPATPADIAAGFNFNQLDNGIRGLERGISDLGYASLQQTNALSTQLAQQGFQAQQCCCETNRNIDNVRYEAARNTCEIQRTVHDEAEKTRALITENVMQELRDNLQSANLTLQNNQQTANLIATIRPTPIPAYPACSPYPAYGMFGCGNGCYNV